MGICVNLFEKEFPGHIERLYTEELVYSFIEYDRDLFFVYGKRDLSFLSEQPMLKVPLDKIVAESRLAHRKRRSI